MLYIHILFAAIWLGGATTSLFFLLSAKNLTPLEAKPILQNVSNLGKFVFAPVAVLVFISGTGLISLAGWSFGDKWISMSFTGIFISIIIGAVFHPRAGRKVFKAIESGSKQDYISTIKNWLIVAYIDLAIIVSILALMVFKPGV